MPGTRSSSTARPTRSAQIPSGIVAGKASAIGAGCVVDPRVVIDELDDLEGRGPRHGRARVPLRERPSDHAVARRPRRRPGAEARQPPDRHDAARHRPRLRRQGDPHRHPRAGSPRPEDPAPEDRARDHGEERLAGARLRDRARSTWKRSRTPTRATRSGCVRTSPTPRCSSTARCATATTSSSRAPRARCSISITAPIRSSPRRARSLPARQSASASGRTGSTRSSASRRRT